jgi:hypothetical protein
LPKKINKVPKEAEKPELFTFRVKLGEREIELKGTHQNVTDTIEKLPKLITNIHKAFDSLAPKTVTTLTVKTEPSASQPKTKKTSQEYPKIASTKSSENAILEILKTNWGKWRPRTMEELQDAIISNNLKFSKTVLTKAISKLVKKGMIRRWNTNAGFVYILAEKKSTKKSGKKK